MATRDRISSAIAAIAASPKNVRFEDVDRVMSQIKTLGVRVIPRHTTHAYQYTVGPVGRATIIRLCTNRRGDSHIKKPYIDAFVMAMIELGFYEE